jgi:hypothetical protein
MESSKDGRAWSIGVLEQWGINPPLIKGSNSPFKAIDILTIIENCSLGGA